MDAESQLRRAARDLYAAERAMYRNPESRRHEFAYIDARARYYGLVRLAGRAVLPL